MKATMTAHAKRTLSYVMCHLEINSRDPAVRRQHAEKWLDSWCEGWRDHQTPKAKRSVVIVSKADEDEEE